MIKSVYVADPKLSRDNLRFDTGTKVYTLRSFLSANAIRSKNSMDDIEYCSTNNSTVCAVQSISVPVLFMGMGAHYFIRDNERHFEMAKSKDKDFIVIEGAVHGFTPCTACETDAGAIFEFREEPLRLYRQMDERPLLSATSKGAERDRRLHLDHRQQPQNPDLPGRSRCRPTGCT